jgi:hypothetical protein
VSLHGSAGGGVDDLPVDFEHACFQRQVEPVRREPDGTGDVSAGGGVVGDDLGKRR